MRKTKFWDGRADHPFFAHLSERIKDLGFVWNGLESGTETDVARWRLALFEGYELELSLMADDARLPSGYFGFMPTLFVVSERQARVWSELRLWECFNLMPGNTVEPEPGPARILAIGLRWLIRAWHEPRDTPWPVPGWSKVLSEEAAACADELGRFLDRHLPRLVPLFEVPAALAHTMLNLETFPGKFDANGPRSACRSIYTAILLHDAGGTGEAMKELDLEKREVAAKVQRGMEPQFLDITHCQIARLTQWMNGGAPPNASTPGKLSG